MSWSTFTLCSRRKLHEAGFTLTELLVTIAIIAIMAAIALPSYQALVINSRMTTQASEFLTTMEFTRSEAVKRNTRVTMCESSDGATCTTAVGWQSGWIVFVDGSTGAVVDGTDTILKVHGALTGGSTLGGTMLNYISYVSTGHARQVDGGMLGGTATLCSTNTSMAGRNVILTTGTGRARITQAACS